MAEHSLELRWTFIAWLLSWSVVLARRLNEDPLRPLTCVCYTVVWGTYPVLARFLQADRGLPAFQLLGAAQGMVGLVALAPRFARGEIRLSQMRSKTVLIYSIAILLAVYFQLISQLTPFFVLGLERVFGSVAIPVYFIPCLILCVIGSTMMVVGDVGHGSIGTSEILGMLSSFASTAFLSIYMVLGSRTRSDANVNEYTLLMGQVFLTFAASAVISFAAEEDFSSWGRLDAVGWFVVVCVGLGVFYGANVLQIFALRKTDARTVALFLPWRLVVTTIFAAVVLGEELRGGLQYGGAVLVAAAVFAYLFLRWRESAKRRAFAQMEDETEADSIELARAADDDGDG